MTKDEQLQVDLTTLKGMKTVEAISFAYANLVNKIHYTQDQNRKLLKEIQKVKANQKEILESKPAKRPRVAGKEKEKELLFETKLRKPNPLIIKIKQHWKDVGLCKIITKLGNEEIKKALTMSSPEECLEAISNYAICLNEPKYFFNHKWDMATFFKKQKGKSDFNYKRFLPEGEFYESFKLNNQANATKENPRSYEFNG